MDCDTALKQLKHALVYARILNMPHFDANFVVEIDTSDVAVSSVLLQYDC